MTTTQHRDGTRPQTLAFHLLLTAALAALTPAAGEAGPTATCGAHRVGAGASHQGHRTQYFVVDLPSLGGTVAEGRRIDSLGVVSGYSNLAGNAVRHAALWLDGEVVDLGTLGGPDSAAIFSGGNHPGVVVGIAEKAELDALGEAWSCSAFFAGAPTGNVCRGFVWQDGAMAEMPTLGGTHSFATAANNRGHVVGWAETDIVDSTCTPPPEGSQVLQFLAVIWDPKTDEIRDLPPLNGDSVGTANAINDRGQVVGISGDCGVAVGGVSARHAVMWEDGAVKDLGNLGDDEWNTPLSINARGEIVGFAGTNTDFLAAFHWTEEEGMVPLGTLKAAHVHSEAWAINNRGQAVGLSCDPAFTDCRAFLWHDGVMTDLNELVAPGYSNHLRLGRAINDDGMITGQSIDPASGQRRAFLAIPIDAE